MISLFENVSPSKNGTQSFDANFSKFQNSLEFEFSYQNLSLLNFSFKPHFQNRHLNGLDKVRKEGLIEQLKHGALSLCRLQHPRILSVERRLEESTYSLVFVTERVQGCLGYLLAKKDEETDSSSGLFDVELRYGLLQVIY